MERLNFLVGGAWRASERSRGVVNPFSGDTVEEVWQASRADVGEAIGRAAAAAEAVAALSSGERAAILEKVSSRVEESREELAALITLETGKPIKFARAEVDRCVFTFAVSGEEARRVGGEVLPLDQTSSRDRRWAIVRRFPVGPVAAITPFNFPLNLVAHKLGPAIAAGDPVVLKPSSNAPGIALRLGSIIMDAGFPPEALSVLTSSSDESSQLVENEQIKLLSFTGSPDVGWELRRRAGRKRVVLELGGNAGVIVDRSADIADAAGKIALGAFGNAGQSCISVQRVFVHHEIYKEFLQDLLSRTRDLQVGDPSDPRTVVGPMIDQAAAAKVEGWIGQAIAAGARVLCGGKRDRALMEPTVLEGVDPRLEVSCKEVFAPVLTVEPFTEFGQAVERVNASEYGLQAGVFSNDHRNILSAFRRLAVGGVIINDASNYRMDHMPYGGVKGSGTGREGVRYAVDEMTEMKLLALADA